MSIEEKIPYMIEWWHTAETMILSSNLNQSMMQEMVYESKMELRKGVQEFIRELLRTQTPILIFSAGLGDIIEIFLKKEIPEFKHNHEFSHIVSNFFQYDTNGNLKASNKKIIHSFNKNEHEIHDTPYYQSILNRPNVILIGDVTGDVAIIEGIKNLKQILKIGYLNRSTPAKLEGYKTVFDIVICDDLTFDIPNVILNAIQ
jgi:5'-nucleotidase